MAGFSIRNPYFIVVCALLIVVLGVSFLAKMPVDMFPNMDITVVVTATFFPGIPTSASTISGGASSMRAIASSPSLTATTRTSSSANVSSMTR